MGKEKFYKKEAFYKYGVHLNEMFIKYSDISYKFISNDRAKYVMGSICRVPQHLQRYMLDEMETIGLIKRTSKREIEIVPV